MKKDAFYFSHDSNARNDPKILAMRNTYKSEGYGYFWIIIETLREQEDFKLPCKKYVYDAFALQLQCETKTVQKYIEDCITEYELFTTDGDFFWSESLLKRMELKNAKAEKNRENANKRWGQAKNIQTDNNDDANAMRTHNERITVAMRNDAKEKKEKKKKEKETKEIHSRAKKRTTPQVSVNNKYPFKEIIDYLNEKTGKSFRHTTNTCQAIIKSRINEGFTLEDFKKVIDNMTAGWIHDTKMSQYLRPQTLFGIKFDSYLNTEINYGRKNEQTGQRVLPKHLENPDYSSYS